VAVLSSVVSTLSDRVDSKFLTAYWLPAFVAGLGGIGILGALVGLPPLDAWVNDLDAAEQSLGALIVLVLITMLAFILRALALPIAAIFAGSVLPQPIAAWSARGQLRARSKATQYLAASPRLGASGSSATHATELLDLGYPKDAADMKATRFGNVLAAAADHAQLVYGMDGALWWPRLLPLLPATYLQILGGAQAPTMAFLNLSVVFCALALSAATILVLGVAQWVTALAFLAAGLLLAHLCYRAAVSQAVELGSVIRVAFDLYRSAILTQLHLESPSDLTAERALWQQLTEQILGLPEGVSPAGDHHGVPADAPKAGETDPHAPPSVS
jgi:hypothetical protein